MFSLSYVGFATIVFHLSTSNCNNTLSLGRCLPSVGIISLSNNDPFSNRHLQTPLHDFCLCHLALYKWSKNCTDCNVIQTKVISTKCQVFSHFKPLTHTYMYLHVQSHLEALSNNSPVSTTQETSGLEAQPPFLSCRHWNWIRSKWNHRIGGKYHITKSLTACHLASRLNLTGGGEEVERKSVLFLDVKGWCIWLI